MHPATGYQRIVYSDLDGTFLDHNSYSFADSLDSYKLLCDRGVPIIFCSSKTRIEIDTLQKKLPGKNPFIVENGAAICIPDDFSHLSAPVFKQQGSYHILQLGVHYNQVVKQLQMIKEMFPNKLISFSDMAPEEVSADAGLSIDQAVQARQREYSEVFKFIDHDPEVESRVIEEIKAYGFMCSKGGRYYLMHGSHDKGQAVKRLNRLFEKTYGRIMTIGIGDSLNDLPMLAAVDQPVLVKKVDGTHDREILQRLPHVHLADGIGPQGWALKAKEIASQIL
ncbi:MAG: HAD-IIB family hydrolase [Desulfobacterales bacterium]|jgi:mannosyl-3-phosphoglycerate phosphatase|nr:HAD-IIB family hydrolase [Desulfobacterales bacterium]